MASNPPESCCTFGNLHEGTIKGINIKINGTLDAYVAMPPEGFARQGTGILYLPDMFGIWKNSQLMADNFAEQGYLTVILDLFNGDPVQLNAPESFDLMQWMAVGTSGTNPHTKEHIDPIIIMGIEYLRNLGITHIGAVGYCFGAKYVVRHYKNGIEVGYVAHPSFVEEDELAAISGPFAISAAVDDPIFPAMKRYKSEEILLKSKQHYQINLYSGTSHGFAVRGDLDVKQQRYAKEQAFFQSVTWFDTYLGS